MRARVTWGAAVVALIVLAAALRLTAIDFGKGLDARPDEPNVVATLGRIQSGGFSPMLVVYGGAYFYPLYGVVRLVGLLAWPEGFAARLAADPEAVRLVARAWSAALSTLTVWLTFVLGGRVGGRATGLLAAAILATAPLAVREAHFGKADTAAACAATVFLLALTHPWTTARSRVVGVALATALALSTKLSIGLVLPILFVLPRADDDRQRLDGRALALAIVLILVVTLALNPFWLTWPALSWLTVRVHTTVLRTISWLPHGAPRLNPLAYHASVSLRYGCGAAMAMLAVPALLVGLARPRLRWIALSVLGHWAIIIGTQAVGARFLLPSLPGLAVLVASLVNDGVGRTAPARWRGASLVAIGSLLLLEPLANSVTFVKLLGRTDTRSLAAAWIDAHIPEEARVVSWGAPPGAVDFGRPPLGRRIVLAGLPPARWRAEGVRYLVQHEYPLPWSSVPLPVPAQALQRLAVFDPFHGPPSSPGPVLEPLDAFYLPLGRFDGVERPGPRIAVFAVPEKTGPP